ncbi:hypothetical protein [Megamonas funiformis]|uniref:hypothetical protein n=1 Tax=Megamonas funiformis TaxID=437897 RepID=UPI003F7E4589
MICSIYENIQSLEKVSELQDYYIRVSDIVPLAEDVAFYSLIGNYGIYLLHTEETKKYYATEVLAVLAPINSDEMGRLYIFMKTNGENSINDPTLRDWYRDNLTANDKKLQANLKILLSMCEEIDNNDL